MIGATATPGDDVINLGRPRVAPFGLAIGIARQDVPPHLLPLPAIAALRRAAAPAIVLAGLGALLVVAKAIVRKARATRLRTLFRGRPRHGIDQSRVVGVTEQTIFRVWLRWSSRNETRNTAGLVNWSRAVWQNRVRVGSPGLAPHPTGAFPVPGAKPLYGHHPPARPIPASRSRQAPVRMPRASGPGGTARSVVAG